MAKVRLPGSRIQALGQYIMLLLPSSWHLQLPFPISTLPPLTPSRNVFLVLLPNPSGWLWQRGPNTCVMNLFLFLACHAQLSKGSSEASWDWWKNKGQEDVCA